MLDSAVVLAILGVFFLLIAVPLSLAAFRLLCRIFNVSSETEEKICRTVAIFFTLGIGGCGFLAIMLAALAVLFAGLFFCEEWFLRYGNFVFAAIIVALTIVLFLISLKIRD